MQLKLHFCSLMGRILKIQTITGQNIFKENNYRTIKISDDLLVYRVTERFICVHSLSLKCDLFKMNLLLVLIP